MVIPVQVVVELNMPWHATDFCLLEHYGQRSVVQRMIKHTCYFNTPPRRSAGAEAETGTEKSARCTACHKGGWTADWLRRYSNAKQVNAIAAELFCCEEAKWSQAKSKRKVVDYKSVAIHQADLGLWRGY